MIFVSPAKVAKTALKIAVPAPPQMDVSPLKNQDVAVVNAKNAFAKPTHFAVNPRGMISAPYNAKKIAVRIAAVRSPVVEIIFAVSAKTASHAPMTVGNVRPAAEMAHAMIRKRAKPARMIAEPVLQTAATSVAVMTKTA